MLGTPENRLAWETGSLWIYDRYSNLFGIADGVVAWKETGRIETPRNPSTTFGQAECGEMRVSP